MAVSTSSAVLAIPLRPMAAGIVMLVAVWQLRPYLPESLPEVVRVGILVAAGAATYGAVMILAFRPLVLEIVSLFVRKPAVTATVTTRSA